ncbi:MAG TPA: ATP-binding protein [Candidatus Kapabacteria bacterium]|nr:ATP-binding protein [Candidatus Kapabacteria bacterium]
MFRRIESKIFGTYLILAIGGIIALGFVVDYQLGDYFIRKHIDDLTQRSRLLEYILQNTATSRNDIRQIASRQGIRITIIDSAGTVMFDSGMPDSLLPTAVNHLNRPEIQESLHDTIGTNQRHSNVTDFDQLYVARAVHINSPMCPQEIRFLRIGVSLAGVNEILNGILARIIIAAIIVGVLIGFASVYIARRITKPMLQIMQATKEIQQGNLDRRITIKSRDELGTLASTINEMVATLQSDIRELKKLEQYRKEFLGNVSHELRTPIFSIQGYIESLQRGAVDDPALSTKFLERAHSNVIRLNTLVNDLLEISLIESGEMRMSFRYFDIIPIMHQVADELEPAAAQKGLQIIVHAPYDDIEVYGDKERIKQVLINLADNAIKYTDQGSITLSVSRIEAQTTISVQDTGVGIPTEHLPRIFERFYRVDKDRSREAGGTGLGLAIVKHILEKHNTKIAVTSTPGNGSTFSFTLTS